MPCCNDYFGDSILLFTQAGQDHEHPILGFLQFLGWQAHAIMPDFFSHEMGETFFPYCSGTIMILILSSQVAQVTVVSHRHPAK
jgi:hypothetical protein